MKKSVLIAAIFCLASTFAFSQINVDVSAGYAHRPTELTLKSYGFFISASPSIALKNKFSLHTTIQFRKEVYNDVPIFRGDQGNLDFSPELEYAWFDFLSLGAGIYYSYNLNNLSSLNFRGREKLEIGPVGYLKFKRKNAFAIIRYSRGVVSQIEDLLGNDNSFKDTSNMRGVFQFGLGYTFKGKNQ